MRPNAVQKFFIFLALSPKTDRQAGCQQEKNSGRNESDAKSARCERAAVPTSDARQTDSADASSPAEISALFRGSGRHGLLDEIFELHVERAGDLFVMPGSSNCRNSEEGRSNSTRVVASSL